MNGIRFCGSGYQSENSFVCFGANPHKDLLREISQGTEIERGKEGPREERRTQTAEENSRQEKAVKRRSVKRWEPGREETSQQKQKGGC